MSLSYSKSKIIKAENIVFKGKRRLKVNIEGQVENTREEPYVDKNLDEEFMKREEEIRLKLVEAENKYEEMIKLAHEESLRIIEDSKLKALDIEKNAYEQGHSQGLKNGYEDGYKEGYEDNIEKAKAEASEIIESANDVLFEAKEYALGYMKENKANILNLSISIAEQVLREKFTDKSAMDNILINVIEEYELKENFVIKVNPLYKENLDKQIIELKESYKINGDVFVLGDESIEEGNAIVDTIKGRLIIGIDSVLDKVKEELL